MVINAATAIRTLLAYVARYDIINVRYYGSQIVGRLTLAEPTSTNMLIKLKIYANIPTTLAVDPFVNFQNITADTGAITFVAKIHL